MPFYTGHFYRELLRGIQHGIAAVGYDLIVYYAERPSSKELYYDRTINEKRCDGVLIVSMDVPTSYIDRFNRTKLPVVLVDRANPALDCILVNNNTGAYDATLHLLDTGHEDIAMISGHESSIPAQQRLAGFKRALESRGKPFKKENIITADQLGDAEEFSVNDGFNAEVGNAAMKQLISRKSRPSAVFGAADIIALGAMKAAQEKRLKIPDDVAIIGFDDIEISAYMGITTVQQPMFDIGRLAVERLMAKIDKKDSIIRMEQLSTKLIIRKTV